MENYISKNKVATLFANREHAIGRGQSRPSKALISSLALALQQNNKQLGNQIMLGYSEKQDHYLFHIVCNKLY